MHRLCPQRTSKLLLPWPFVTHWLTGPPHTHTHIHTPSSSSSSSSSSCLIRTFSNAKSARRETKKTHEARTTSTDNQPDSHEQTQPFFQHPPTNSSSAPQHTHTHTHSHTFTQRTLTHIHTQTHPSERKASTNKNTSALRARRSSQRAGLCFWCVCFAPLVGAPGVCWFGWVLLQWHGWGRLQPCCMQTDAKPHFFAFGFSMPSPLAAPNTKHQQTLLNPARHTHTHTLSPSSPSFSLFLPLPQHAHSLLLALLLFFFFFFSVFFFFGFAGRCTQEHLLS